jgi:hypothetical protein
VVTPAEIGATFRYAKVSNYNDDPVFGTTSSFDMANNDYLYIEITSKGGNVLYYFFQVKLENSNFGIKVQAANNTAKLAEPNKDPWLAEAGQLLLPPTTTGDVTVTVFKDYGEQTIKFARTGTGGGTPTFEAGTDTDATTVTKDYSFEDGDNLFIGVTEKGGNYKMIYKIAVIIKNNVATLSALQIGDHSQSSLGTPHVIFGQAARTTITWADRKMAAQIVATVTTGSGAAVKYAVSRRKQLTTPVFGAVETFDFDYGSTWLDIQVTAENGATINYYRYRINAGSADNTLTTNPITIGTTSATRGTPNAAPTSATAVIVTLTDPQTNITITGATPTNEHATLKYAKTTVEADTPVFGTNAAFSFAKGSSWLYIEVTAQNGVSTTYRFRVAAGSIGNSLNTVSAGAQSLTPSTSNANSANAVAVEVLLATPLSAAAISATGSSGAAIKYGTSSSDAAPSVYYNIGDARTWDFGYGSTWIFFEVTAENGTAAYYKFVLRVGSADKGLGSLSVKGVPVTNLGTPGAAQNVTAANRGEVSISGPLGANTEIIAVAAPATATVEWASARAGTGSSVTLNGSYGTAPVTFGQSGYFNYNLLVVRVTSQNGVSDYYVITVSTVP